MGHLLGAHAVHVHLGVHGSHGRLVDGTVQSGQHLGQFGVGLQELGIHKVHSVVRREEAQIVLQHSEAQLGQQSIRGKGVHHVHLVVLNGGIAQAGVQALHVLESGAVLALQQGQAVLAVHKLHRAAETQLRGLFNQVRQRGQAIFLRSLGLDAHHIGVVIAQGVGGLDPVILQHQIVNGLPHPVLIGVHRLGQQVQQRRSGILHKHIDAALLQGVKAHGRAG